jgi:tetratricopeptide (TPR) repeat protein
MLPILLERPLLGLGPGGFAHRIPEQLARTAPERDTDLVFLHAHLLPAELLMELGLIGTGCILLFVAAVYRAAWRNGYRCRSWLVWAHGAWLLTNLYDVNFFTYAGWVTLWPLLAVLQTAPAGAAASIPPAPTGVPGRIVATLPLALTAVLLVRLVTSSFLCHQALWLARGSWHAAAAQRYQVAAAAWPLPVQERYRAALAELSAGSSERCVEQLMALEEQAPAFAASRYNLAIALAKLGRHPEALAWMRSHLETHPNDTRAMAALTELQNQAPTPGG